VNVENMRMEGVKHTQADENMAYTVETELTLTAYTLSGAPPTDGAAAGTQQIASADGAAPQAAAAAQH
jgi:hypothetical protein